MKHTILLLLVLIGIGAQAQSPSIPVLPTPQKVTFHEGTLAVLSKQAMEMNPHLLPAKAFKKIIKEHNVFSYRDSLQICSLPFPDQAYKLIITPQMAEMVYLGEEGYENALATLVQLSGRYGDTIPCMEIVDYPAFEFRGWMDDISRGPIPNAGFREFQQYIITKFYKMNVFTYYTEHTFQHPDYGDISPLEGLSRGEFDDNPQAIANLQLLAHFEKTLQIPFYTEIKDTRSNVNPGWWRTKKILNDLVKDVAEAYPLSRFFNINCDETEALGTGRAREYVQEVGGADEAYCKHINTMYSFVKDHGKEVMMWGDIVAKNPAMIKELPHDMNYIVWSYEPHENFQEILQPFVDAQEEQGNPFWVAAGVSHWSNIYPNVNKYVNNISHFARDGYLNGARGFLNTSWDDSGESLFADAFHAILWGAEMAWNPIKETDPEKAKEEISRRLAHFNEVFNEQFPPVTGEGCLKMGEVADIVGDWYNVAALNEPLLDFFPSRVDSSMILRINTVEKQLEPYFSDPQMQADPFISYAFNRIKLTIRKNRLRIFCHDVFLNSTPEKVKNLNSEIYFYNKALHELKLQYLSLWDQESGQYFRDEICRRYDNLCTEALEAMNHVFILTEGNKVTLKTLSGNLPIYYTLDGRKPSQGTSLYKEPFLISRSGVVKAVSFNEFNEGVMSEKYLLCHKGMGHLKKLNGKYSSYSATYSAGGDNALLDGELGDDDNYKDGHWQGYWGENVDIELDFGKLTEVNTLSMRFLQNTYDWILAPEKVEVFVSKDGINYQSVRVEELHPEFRQGGNILNEVAVRDLALKTRYLRVVAYNPGKLPEWHPAKGWDSYLFVDELVVE